MLSKTGASRKCPTNQLRKVKNANQKNYNLKCGTWNICRGLITREHELKTLLKDESLDILFITETDTNMLDSEEDYLIEGYKTIFPKKSENVKKLGIICWQPCSKVPVILFQNF